MAEPRPAFQQLQYAFAAHLRDPARQPPPEGIEAPARAQAQRAAAQSGKREGARGGKAGVGGL